MVSSFRGQPASAFTVGLARTLGLMKKVRLPPAILCNPDNWSASSKQSHSYNSAPSEYRDRNYVCWRCKQPDVYTAQEQREAYEVRKVYIWQTRVLCKDCFRTRVSIEASLKQCRTSWQEESEALRTDTEYLKRWRSLLQEHVHYGGKADEGNLHMLEQLLRQHEA